MAANVGAGSEYDIAASQANQLAAAQASLHGNQQQRAIPPPDPCGWVRGSDESCHLLLAEELHGAALVALGRDREDALAEQSVGGFLERDVSEERVKRGESDVAGACRTTALMLDVVQELTQQPRVKILNAQTVRWTADALSGEAEQKSKGIPVTRHSVRARAELSKQAVRKEPLQQCREVRSRCHAAPPLGCPMRRSVASCRSSGTASRYQ